ncbi:MAG: flagellar biosynthesis protein FlhB [Tepidisphaeraceae bacterium]|jgi:flagellar biosynthetic protein FlhB
MAEESMADKTEAPTARRRQEAREQGQVARSPDLTAAVLLLGGLLLLRWFGMGVVAALHSVVAENLAAPALADTNSGRIGAQILHSVLLAGVGMAPLLGGMVLIIIAVNVAQVGFNINGARLAPNLAALNPFRGLNRILGPRQGGMQLLMNLLKVVLVGLIAYSAVNDRLGQIVSVQQYSFLQIFGIGCDIVFAIGLRVGVLLLVLAIIDYVHQRFRHEKQLKMTKQEVKDEMRRMEGDPLIKQRRRQIAVQRAMQKLKKDIPKADVVVTNPTHYAVALKYDEETMHAPRVVAKGVDFMAQRIRQLAVEAGVPIVERAPLARAMYRMVEVGQEIPEEFYAAVAEILAYVYELTGKTVSRAVAV